jgi:2-polyprenyl-3-methyl-5-hydroxy-6-metoxy-1,4-benzoquinol methylase
LARIERFLAWRRASKEDPDVRRLECLFYFLNYSRLQPPFILEAESQLVVDSADHLWPHGTICDNSASPAFNRKLYAMFQYRPDLTVLDLGCSGGGFVKSILEDGFVAIGLEGSDASKKLQRAEWKTIPLHLFTCDITKSFLLKSGRGERVLFDAITAWEVLEHISKDRLPGLMKNIWDNLKPAGVFFASVATFPDANPISNAVYHVTLEGRDWWIRQFVEFGFALLEGHQFETGDWVRGNGKGITNWDPADGDGFHIVLTKNP